jgi:hypothetical protein
MLELITGCLQVGQSGDRSYGDLVDRYEEEPSSLKDTDVDPKVGNQLDEVVDQLTTLALKCVQPKPRNRPSTEAIINDLASVLAVMEGRQFDSQPVPVAALEVPMKQCCLCARSMQVGITCSDEHFVDHECLEEHVVKHLTTHLGSPVPCPIGGCGSGHLAATELYGKISISAFNLMSMVQQSNNQIGGKEVITLLREIAAGVQNMEGQLVRHTAALARLGAGNTSSCPRLIWVIHSKGNRQNFVPRVGKKGVKLYFICQHSFSAVSPALEFDVTRDWVKTIAPALKVSAFLLKAAIAVGKLVGGLPFPDPLANITFQVDAFDDYASDMLDGASETLQELIELDKSIADNSVLDGVGNHRIAEVVGNAYHILEEKANKDKHSGWQASMTAVLDKSGTQIYVKREYANSYA